MEPIEPSLEEEVARDTTIVRTEAVIGGLVVLVLVLGAVIWYMATHPPHPITQGTPGTASTSPSKPGAVATPSLNEETAYYVIKASYPASTPLRTSAGGAADAKAVEAMKQFEVNTIDAFKEQGNFAHLTANDIKMMGFDQGRKESVDITYQKKTGLHTLSYLFTLTEDTFGAHPNTFFRAFTFDTKTGEELDLGDIFAPGVNYLSLLSTQSRKLLPATIAAREGIKVSAVDTAYIARGTTPDADNFQTWYLEGSNLFIVFPPYQVAPYAAGEQTVSIPLSQLGASLAAKYK
jgi:hypothetical protein